jgi:Transglutaminase-like superfamily
MAGNCRTFTVLLVSILRAHGTPARARCGFGSYFVEGRNEDHWVAEYWNADEERWVLVDAQIDEPQREAFPIDFDVTDVPRDRFIIAGDAWAACQANDADPETFGLTTMNEAGMWWIASNLMRDAAALQNIELLPWDDWGAMPGPDDVIEGDLRDLFDRMASLTHEPDAVLPELHELQQTDNRIRVPSTVRNYARGRDEPI